MVWHLANVLHSHIHPQAIRECLRPLNDYHISSLAQAKGDREHKKPLLSCWSRRPRRRAHFHTKANKYMTYRRLLSHTYTTLAFNVNAIAAAFDTENPWQGVECRIYRCIRTGFEWNGDLWLFIVSDSSRSIRNVLMMVINKFLYTLQCVALPFSHS